MASSASKESTSSGRAAGKAEWELAKDRAARDALARDKKKRYSSTDKDCLGKRARRDIGRPSAVVIYAPRKLLIRTDGSDTDEV